MHVRAAFPFVHRDNLHTLNSRVLFDKRCHLMQYLHFIGHQFLASNTFYPSPNEQSLLQPLHKLSYSLWVSKLGNLDVPLLFIEGFCLRAPSILHDFDGLFLPERVMGSHENSNLLRLFGIERGNFALIFLLLLEGSGGVDTRAGSTHVRVDFRESG
jgi:hypothetical protein